MRRNALECVREKERRRRRKIVVFEERERRRKRKMNSQLCKEKTDASHSPQTVNVAKLKT